MVGVGWVVVVVDEPLMRRGLAAWRGLVEAGGGSGGSGGSGGRVGCYSIPRLSTNLGLWDIDERLPDITLDPCHGVGYIVNRAITVPHNLLYSTGCGGCWGGWWVLVTCTQLALPACVVVL